MTIEKFEVEVNVQNMVLKLRETLCLSYDLANYKSVNLDANSFLA